MALLGVAVDRCDSFVVLITVSDPGDACNLSNYTQKSLTRNDGLVVYLRVHQSHALADGDESTDDRRRILLAVRVADHGAGAVVHLRVADDVATRVAAARGGLSVCRARGVRRGAISATDEARGDTLDDGAPGISLRVTASTSNLSERARDHKQRRGSLVNLPRQMDLHLRVSIAAVLEAEDL